MVAMPYTQRRKAISHAVNTLNRFAPGTRLGAFDQGDFIRLLKAKFLQQCRQCQGWIKRDLHLETVFTAAIHKD